VKLLSRDDGFTMVEMLVATTVMLLVIGATLATFKNATDINNVASAVGDTNQNIRAGTNQLVRDLMMAGRIIANGGVPAPSGAGSLAIKRPGPPGSALTFGLIADDDGTLMLPAITTGYQLGPVINGEATDLVTILTVDEFMPALQGIGAGVPAGTQAVIAADGSGLTVPAASPWLVGDAVNDTAPINVGDLVLFKNTYGLAVQTVTSVDTTHIYFASSDWAQLNQRNAAFTGTIYCLKTPPAGTVPPNTCDPSTIPATLPVPAATLAATFPNTSVMRLLMITYYVDNSTTPGTPRLTRLTNNGAPQALAGIVEDLNLTYDLVDPANSGTVSAITSLPYTLSGTTYTSSMIEKVNIHVGVRSESTTNPTRQYIRTHINTAVDTRSIASVDRYDTGQSQ
jgi:prepilin-type N-terminal cleavage/methylation domain-containing protein